MAVLLLLIVESSSKEQAKVGVEGWIGCGWVLWIEGQDGEGVVVPHWLSVLVKSSLSFHGFASSCIICSWLNYICVSGASALCVPSAHIMPTVSSYHVHCIHVSSACGSAAGHAHPLLMAQLLVKTGYKGLHACHGSIFWTRRARKAVCPWLSRTLLMAQLQVKARYKGCMPVAEYDFAQQFSDFSFRTLLTKSEVISALTRVRVECAKALKMSLFNTHFTKSLRLEEFEQGQMQTTDQVCMLRADQAQVQMLR
eukprot:1137442-Pelagomonas_calceolata.AAC.3